MANVLPLPRTRDSVRTADPMPEHAVGDAPLDRTEEAPVVDHEARQARPVAAAAVARVDAVQLGSLAWLALRCALVATIIGGLGAGVVWVLAAGTGVIGRWESFMESIGFRDFHVSAGRVIAGTMLVVAGLALAVATAVVVAGAAYNVFAVRGGGLKLRVAVIGAAPVAPDAAPPPVVPAPS